MTNGPENLGTDLSPADRCAQVTAHWEGVYRLMYRLCGHAHDAEELTQDTFLRAFQKMHQFQPNTNLRGWLMRIGTNLFLDAKRRRTPATADLAPLEVADARLPDGGTPEQRELGQQLQQALARISETQRAVFLLRATENLSFGEIAQAIGSTEPTARWHMMQARHELLRLLEGKL